MKRTRTAQPRRAVGETSRTGAPSPPTRTLTIIAQDPTLIVDGRIVISEVTIPNEQLGAGCTSGFGVQNYYGSRFILTAGHCGWVGNDFYNGDWTRRMGMAYSKHTAYDVMLIPTDAGGRIYDGGVGTNEFSKDVVGAGQVFMGEWLCTWGCVRWAVC